MNCESASGKHSQILCHDSITKRIAKTHMDHIDKSVSFFFFVDRLNGVHGVSCTKLQSTHETKLRFVRDSKSRSRNKDSLPTKQPRVFITQD